MTGLELQEKLLSRIAKLEGNSGISFIDALNAGVEVIFLRLWHRKTDIVMGKLAVSDVTDTATLPDDLRGLASMPYLVDATGGVIYLSPLPIDGAAELEGATSTPNYFEVIGKTLELFPKDSTARTLKAKYFQAPAALELTGTLPWDGKLNSVIEDATVAAIRFGGLASMLANEEFLNTMHQAIDQVFVNRNHPAPRRVKPHYF